MEQFKRHFRVYFVNNHPAYIVDEEGNEYVFHRVTHSKTSGGRKNWPKQNPLVRDDSEVLYIVRKEQRDLKNRFSPFELEIRTNFDISYPEIKKASDVTASNTGNHQAKHGYFKGRSRYESSTNIKSNKRNSRKRKKH